MGELGEAFENPEQLLVPRAAPDLHIAGTALRAERPKARQLVATLRGRRRGEAVERAHEMLHLALAGLPRILAKPDADRFAVLLGGVAQQALDVTRIGSHTHHIQHVVAARPVAAELDADRPIGVVQLGLFGGGEIPVAHDIELGRDLVGEGAPLPFEIHPGGRPDLPIAAEQPLALERRQRQQPGVVIGVGPEQDRVVEHGCRDKRDADRPWRLEARRQMLRLWQMLHQFLGPVGPDRLLGDTDVVTQHTSPLGDRQSALRVDPPRQEVGDPAIGVRVAGGADVRLDAAGRAVAADHVEELMRGEMGQFIKADQRDLSALPVKDRAVELQVRELDLAAAPPAPLAHSDVRGSAEPGIEVLALIPQPAGVGDLRCRAPEEHRGEVCDPRGVAQRFEDQSDGLSAACRAAIDADVGRAAEKVGLRSGLRRDRHRRCGVARRAPGSPYRAGAHLFCCNHVRSSTAESGGLLAKYLSCASRSTCVSSGSRLLSGKTRTTSELAWGSGPDSGSPRVGSSRHCARVFSQKMVAGMLPALAAANRYPQTVALASATPRSSSSRNRLRKVFAAQPMILAMSSCRTPTPARYRTRSRTASLATKAGLAMGAVRLILRQSGGFIEGLTGRLMDRGASGEELPPAHDHIDIGGVELETVAAALAHLGGDQTGSRTEKRVVDQLAGPAVVGDRPAHAFDRLLGAVPPALRVVLVAKRIVVGDLPECRLRAVALPVGRLAIAHGIPAAFVLPMIMAAAQREGLPRPHDLGAGSI